MRNYSKTLERALFKMLKNKPVKDLQISVSYEPENEVHMIRISYKVITEIETTYYFTYVDEWLYKFSKYYFLKEGYPSIEEMNGYDLLFINDINNLVCEVLKK